MDYKWKKNKKNNKRNTINKNSQSKVALEWSLQSIAIKTFRTLSAIFFFSSIFFGQKLPFYSTVYTRHVLVNKMNTNRRTNDMFMLLYQLKDQGQGRIIKQTTVWIIHCFYVRHLDKFISSDNLVLINLSNFKAKSYL